MAFTDYLKLQNFVAQALLCEDWLTSVNVVTRDQVLLDESRLPDETLAAETLVYITERNGRKGCGVIVEKPVLEVALDGVLGPQGDLLLTCLVLEDPLQNEAPESGTLRSADQVGQKILDVCHLWALDGMGIFRADKAALVPARDWEPLRAYRARLRISQNRGQTARCARVVIGIQAGAVTLACATEGAQIFWTADESFPGKSNAAAQAYGEPFEVAAGTVITAAAFADGFSMSAVASKNV